MNSNNLIKLFNQEAEAIGRIQTYSNRYISVRAFRQKWFHVNQIQSLLSADMRMLSKKSYCQLLSISYNLIASKILKCEDLIHMTQSDRYGVSFASCVMNWNGCWDLRNDPNKLSLDLANISFNGLPVWVYAGLGDIFLPYITYALYYRRNNYLCWYTLSKFTVDYTKAMIYDYYDGSPTASHFIDIYTRFGSSPYCRETIVRCLAKYPKDCKDVVSTMRRIAQNDKLQRLRDIAELYIKS